MYLPNRWNACAPLVHFVVQLLKYVFLLNYFCIFTFLKVVCLSGRLDRGVHQYRSSVSEGVLELSQRINYSCPIMPEPVRIWVTTGKDWNSTLFVLPEFPISEIFLGYFKSRNFSALISIECIIISVAPLENWDFTDRNSLKYVRK